jgi:soluble lytic murein transglycosylase
MKSFFARIAFIALLCCFFGTNAGLSIASEETSKGDENHPQKWIMSENSVSQGPESLCSTDGCTHLREGKRLLEAGMLSEAIDKLQRAFKELPLVGDYALFFMAKAHAKAGAFNDSEQCLNKLFRLYPDSLLKRKARALEVRNSIANSAGVLKKETDDAGTKTLEQYVADYPEDTEMKFLLGQAFKKHGKGEQAKKIFKDIYVTSSSFSESVYAELEPSDITAQDMLAKASNLLNEMEYKKAETLLRKTLSIADEPLRDDVEKKLGIALFAEKRYQEAAAEFSKASDGYNAARSFYRAGDLEAFHAAVTKLISMEDRRVAALLIAFAAKKRRQGEIQEALRIYDSVKSKYPAHAEEALWGTAWTFYRSGDYKTSLKVLNELDKTYPSSRYLYWKAKCLEALTGSEAFPEGEQSTKSVFHELAGRKNDFYGLLAEMHDNDYQRPSRDLPPLLSDNFTALQQGSCTQSSSRVSEDIPESSPAHEQGYTLPLQKNHAVPRSLERFIVILSIGMKEDAIAELITSREFSNPGVLLSACHALQEVGAYKNAIALISRLTSQEKSRKDINDILYPLAFWPIVEEAAKSSNLDPYILLSVMREESRFDPDARSEAGAIGLMQVMPQTAGSIGRRAAMQTQKSEIRDVRTNIAIGSYYLGLLTKEFGSLPPVIAAYNAGEEKIREWTQQGKYASYDEFIEDIPYDETRNYVKKVLTTYAAYRRKAEQDPFVCTQQESP